MKQNTQITEGKNIMSTVYVVVGVYYYEGPHLPTLRVFSDRAQAEQYGRQLVEVPDEDGDTWDTYHLSEQHVA